MIDGHGHFCYMTQYDDNDDDATDTNATTDKAMKQYQLSILLFHRPLALLRA